MHSMSGGQFTPAILSSSFNESYYTVDGMPSTNAKTEAFSINYSYSPYKDLSPGVEYWFRVIAAIDSNNETENILSSPVFFTTFRS